MIVATITDDRAQLVAAMLRAALEVVPDLRIEFRSTGLRLVDGETPTQVGGDDDTDGKGSAGPSEMATEHDASAAPSADDEGESVSELPAAPAGREAGDRLPVAGRDGEGEHAPSPSPRTTRKVRPQNRQRVDDRAKRVAIAAQIVRDEIDAGRRTGFGRVIAERLGVHQVTAAGYLTEAQAKGLVTLPRAGGFVSGPIGKLPPPDEVAARERAADGVGFVK